MGIKDSSLWAREILSFLETAKNGSINGTAEANAMKQSNLSRTLKSLEEKLKCQLLERGYNGVRRSGLLDFFSAKCYNFRCECNR